MTSDKFIQYINKIDPAIKPELEVLGFKTQPASRKHHGAYTGGLMSHSIEVTDCLIKLTNALNLKWERDISPYVIGMFHDLCKCDLYIAEWDESQQKSRYSINKNSLLKGHGSKSVILASQLIRLTNEEIMCIRYHMGPFEISDQNDYTRAIKKYPNVLYTHVADMMASQIHGI